MLIKPLLQWRSPGGAQGRLSVLVFHRVLPEPDPLFPGEMHARRFDELCGWLARWFKVLPLDQAVARHQTGRLPARAACITFDDGYADNHHVARPILQRHGLTATFFIATGFLDGGRMWNDTLIETIRACTLPVLDLSCIGWGRHELGSLQERKQAMVALIEQARYLPAVQRHSMTQHVKQLARAKLPDDLMMTSPEVRALHQSGMQIGAHTVTHPILSQLNDAQARHEIQTSQQTLEQLIDARVGLFAYPNGKPEIDYTPRTVAVVRSLGFDAAVSTQWGALGPGSDLFQIRRFTPWDQTRLRFGARLLQNLQAHPRST